MKPERIGRKRQNIEYLKNDKRFFLCYLFLLFRTFYVSIFHYKIDSLEEYSLATGKAMSFTYFKPQYITQENLVFNFLYGQGPRKIQYN